MLSAIKGAFVQQCRGRSRAWETAFLLSSFILILQFYLRWPTCDLMFHRADLAKDYAIFWLILFIFIGLTNRGKMVFGVVVIIALSTRPLTEYRIPTNERRTVTRLREIHSTLTSAKEPQRILSDVVGPTVVRFGYVLEVDPQFSGDVVPIHYVVRARPLCYCRTGRLSFALEENGAIHYTRNDRGATSMDPVLSTE
jgi:hypothetical protein